MSYNYLNIEGTFKSEGYELTATGDTLLVGTLLVDANEARTFKFPLKVYASEYATKDLLSMDNKTVTMTGKLIPSNKTFAIYLNWYTSPVVEPVAETTVEPTA